MAGDASDFAAAAHRLKQALAQRETELQRDHDAEVQRILQTRPVCLRERPRSIELPRDTQHHTLWQEAEFARLNAEFAELMAQAKSEYASGLKALSAESVVSPHSPPPTGRHARHCRWSAVLEGALAAVRARRNLWVYLGTLPVIIGTIQRPPSRTKDYPEASGIDCRPYHKTEEDRSSACK